MSKKPQIDERLLTPLGRAMLAYYRRISAERQQALLDDAGIGSDYVDRLCALPDGWRMAGCFAFMIEDAQLVPFVPCKGHLGFWKVLPETLAALRAAIPAPNGEASQSAPEQKGSK